MHVNCFVTSVINGKHKLGNVTSITKTTNEHNKVSVTYYVLWNTYNCSLPYTKSELIYLRDPSKFKSTHQPEQTNSQEEAIKIARINTMKNALEEHSNSLLLLREQNVFYKHIVSISELAVKKKEETDIISQRRLVGNKLGSTNKEMYNNAYNMEELIDKFVEDFDKTVFYVNPMDSGDIEDLDKTVFDHLVVYKHYETHEAPTYTDNSKSSPLKICE